MLIRYKLFLAFGAVLVLAACVAFYGLHAIASAGNLVVQLYDQSFIASNSARGAQVRFNEGRAAVERGLASHQAAAKATIDAFTAAAKDVGEELKVSIREVVAASALPGLLLREVLVGHTRLIITRPTTVAGWEGVEDGYIAAAVVARATLAALAQLTSKA
jgi:hypothetical protein